jgi:hypothetical protein
MTLSNDQRRFPGSVTALGESFYIFESVNQKVKKAFVSLALHQQRTFGILFLKVDPQAAAKY